MMRPRLCTPCGTGGRSRAEHPGVSVCFGALALPAASLPAPGCSPCPADLRGLSPCQARARPGWQGRSRPVRPQLQLGPAPGGRRGCCGSGSGARGSDKRSILSSRAGAAAGPVRGMCAVIGSGMREPSQPPVSTVTAVRCHPSVQLSPREGRGSFSLLTRCKCPLSG